VVILLFIVIIGFVFPTVAGFKRLLGEKITVAAGVPVVHEALSVQVVGLCVPP